MLYWLISSDGTAKHSNERVKHTWNLQEKKKSTHEISIAKGVGGSVRLLDIIPFHVHKPASTYLAHHSILAATVLAAVWTSTVMLVTRISGSLLTKLGHACTTSYLRVTWWSWLKASSSWRWIFLKCYSENIFLKCYSKNRSVQVHSHW